PMKCRVQNNEISTCFVRHENTSMLKFGCIALDFQLTSIASLLSLSSCDSTSCKVNISDDSEREVRNCVKTGKATAVPYVSRRKSAWRSSLGTISNNFLYGINRSFGSTIWKINT
ncbi:hypothetical protein ACROYT_G032303, partial [Oculina patagonica]